MVNVICSVEKCEFRNAMGFCKRGVIEIKGLRCKSYSPIPQPKK